MNATLRSAVAALALAALGGGVQAQDAAARASNPADPLEGWNRAVFSFNDAVDSAVLQPVARGYKAVVPEPLRAGVTNFFANIGDVWSAVNNALQGKGEAAATSVARVATNTLFGIGGVFDVASDLGMERRSEDFGQTLGRWGLPPGPYLVLPLLGPSSVRDTAGLALDMQAGVGALTDDRRAANSLRALNIVDTRTNLLGASRVLDDVALDKYSFLRDAYLARRRSLVHDGDPPPLPEDRDEPPPAR
ncbi:MAG TPA: VacJ family lipoprotein [Burkholderiaceae bacterium]|nr:VacJ family lipoprotein [Burkholderiaceae bacterium]